MLFVCESAAFPLVIQLSRTSWSFLPGGLMASRKCGHRVPPWPVSASSPFNGTFPLATTLLQCREREREKKKVVGWQSKTGRCKEWDGGCFSVLWAAAVKCRCAFFSSFKQGVFWRPSHRVHLDPKGHITYFTVGPGWLNSLFCSYPSGSSCLYHSVLCGADGLWGSKISC